MLFYTLSDALQGQTQHRQRHNRRQRADEHHARGERRVAVVLAGEDGGGGACGHAADEHDHARDDRVNAEELERQERNQWNRDQAQEGEPEDRLVLKSLRLRPGEDAADDRQTEEARVQAERRGLLPYSEDRIKPVPESGRSYYAFLRRFNAYHFSDSLNGIKTILDAS